MRRQPPRNLPPPQGEGEKRSQPCRGLAEVYAWSRSIVNMVFANGFALSSDPTLDNLRNLFRTPTTEMFSFLQQFERRSNGDGQCAIV